MILRQLVDVKNGEVPALLWSFAYFFCLLCSYYILRPVRDEMGIQGGVQHLQWVFTGTFLAMLAAVALFGWASARLARPRLLPAVYGFFILNLLAFFALFESGAAPAAAARAFFIWVSVFNLFVVSVFWSFMADLFSNEQAKRLFGFIAAGGSAGAILGPALTASLVAHIGVFYLLLLSALLLALAVGCIARLGRWARAAQERLTHAAAAEVPRSRAEAPLGGGVLTGIRLVMRSPYLLGMCLYVLLYTLLSTFLYFEQAHMVAEAFAGEPARRTRLFAAMDLAVNTLTICGQMFLAARVIAWFGVPLAFSLIPALSVVGFAALAIMPTLAVLLALQVIRRAGGFAIAAPVREVLFTVISREEKYKSKNFIDTVISRASDTLGAWMFTALAGLGLGLAGIALASVPLAAAWVAIAAALGRRQETLRVRVHEPTRAL